MHKANITVSAPTPIEGEHAEISYVEQNLTNGAEKEATRQLVGYLLSTQKRSLAHLQIAKSYEVNHICRCHILCRIIWNWLLLPKLAKKWFTFWVLDKTHTAMGGRLLKQWLARPLLNMDEINHREEMVQALLDGYFTRENAVDALKGVTTGAFNWSNCFW